MIGIHVICRVMDGLFICLFIHKYASIDLNINVDQTCRVEYF